MQSPPQSQVFGAEYFANVLLGTLPAYVNILQFTRWTRLCDHLRIFASFHFMTELRLQTTILEVGLGEKGVAKGSARRVSFVATVVSRARSRFAVCTESRCTRFMNRTSYRTQGSRQLVRRAPRAVRLGPAIRLPLPLRSGGIPSAELSSPSRCPAAAASGGSHSNTLAAIRRARICRPVHCWRSPPCWTPPLGIDCLLSFPDAPHAARSRAPRSAHRAEHSCRAGGARTRARGSGPRRAGAGRWRKPAGNAVRRRRTNPRLALSVSSFALPL